MNYFLCELIRQTLACTTASKMAASLPPTHPPPCEHCLLQPAVGKHIAGENMVEYVMEHRRCPYDLAEWLKWRGTVVFFPPTGFSVENKSALLRKTALVL